MASKRSSWSTHCLFVHFQTTQLRSAIRQRERGGTKYRLYSPNWESWMVLHLLFFTVADQFHAVFGNIWQNRMLVTPESWRPHVGEILDTPLFHNWIVALWSPTILWTNVELQLWSLLLWHFGNSRLSEGNITNFLRFLFTFISTPLSLSLPNLLWRFGSWGSLVNPLCKLYRFMETLNHFRMSLKQETNTRQ